MLGLAALVIVAVENVVLSLSSSHSLATVACQVMTLYFWLLAVVLLGQVL